MLYTIEQYYKECRTDIDYESINCHLLNDKIASVMILSGYSYHKNVVNLADFLSLIKYAQNSECISVYVNVYGRPISYVIWGYYNASSRGELEEVHLERYADQSHAFIIDFAIQGNSLDDTITLWLDSIRSSKVTVCRNNRPKEKRTYDIARIRKFSWRNSRVIGRFSLPKGHGIAEHEAVSKGVMAQYRAAQWAIETICDDMGGPIDIGSAVPLVMDLLSIGQCHVSTRDAGDRAVLVTALSDSARWKGQQADDIFELPFRKFVDGNDVIIAGIYGNAEEKIEILDRCIMNLSRSGEKALHIPKSIYYKMEQGFESVLKKYDCDLFLI